MYRPPPSFTLFPYTTLFRSAAVSDDDRVAVEDRREPGGEAHRGQRGSVVLALGPMRLYAELAAVDRKSTRLKSQHPSNSYALFCFKKKKTLAYPYSMRRQHK